MTQDCKHEGEHLTGPEYGMRCKHCRIALCSDCGYRPIHEDSTPGYCRPCSEKGGHRSDFITVIDNDLLRTKLGRETADDVMKTCSTYSVRN